MSLIQKARLHATLAALSATSQDPETHAAVRRLAEADGRLVAEKLAPIIVRTASFPEAQRILERGVEGYMEDRINTLRLDGAQDHDIGAYGFAYVVSVMDRMDEIGIIIDRQGHERQIL